MVTIDVYIYLQVGHKKLDPERGLDTVTPQIIGAEFTT